MKPIRITITAIVLMLFHWVATAQPINKTINDVVMPAPNAASLGKYGDIPVSYFTGVPNISVPVYTVQEGPLSLPISLSYHASGVKINENASWVGLNWSLNAGGVVSRTVLGLPDEINTGYFDYGNTLVEPMLPNDITSTQQMEAVAVGSRDAEPDLFNFNVGGYTGKFVFDKDKNVHLIPKSDLKVEYVRVTGTGNPSNTYFIRFIITTPDGTRYIFGSLEGEANNAYSGIEFNYYDNIQTNSIAPSSWYLRRIESPDRHYQITIDYQSETYNYRSLGSCSFFYDQYSGGPSGSCGPVPVSQYVSVTNNSIQGKKLWRIVSSTTTVNFIANTNREDIPSQKRLDAIEIMHPGNANYCSRFDLTYDYMLSPNSTAPVEEYKRLRLLELQEKSCDNSIVNPAYKFSYIAGSLPHRISRATDHWGFHNGATQNETTFGIPPVSATLGSQTIAPPYANAYRETSESHMQIGTLNKVEYPTGGYTQLTYEANEYLDYQNVTSEQFSVGPLSNCTYPQAACCTNTQTVTTFTFNAAQLNQAKFRLTLTNLNIGPYQYCNIGNPNPPSPSVNITVKQTSNNVVVGSYGFNLTNTQSSNTITQLLTTLANLSASVSYTFTLTVQHGKGEFSIFTEGSTIINVNKKAGGLRVKEIRIHDGIAAGNDIVKQYKYTENASTNSSGKLYSKPEYFGFTYSTYQGLTFPVAVTFFSQSIAPMSSFEGYHISYKRVSEETVGGGKTVYFFNQEPNSQFFQETYPYTPAPAKVKDGQEEKMEVYNSSNTKLSETASNFYVDSYTNLPGFIYKAVKQDLGVGPGGQPRIYLYAKPYPIRTAPFRHASKQETRDGVVTTTSFQYDAQNRHYAPTAILLTNSDGKTTTTRNKYVFDWPTSTLRTEMINRNMIGSPVETTTEVNSVTVGGSRTDYSFFNSTGFPTATATGNHPYPYQFYSYEMTWMNGVATSGAWVLKGTTNEYQSTSNAGKGYPRKFTQAGWLPETYTWQNNLITNRTYSGFSWNYSYHSGTRLLASITEIDGQTQTFAYDKLRRLQTITARGGNVTTAYQYQLRNAQNPNNFVRSTTNFTPVSGSNFVQRETVQYLDGLGRPIQDVKTKYRPGKGTNDQSNTISDVVVNHTYDNQGRLVKTTVPYISPYNTGAYYAPPAGTLFTLTGYENSPLNRVYSITAPNGYTATTTYSTNSSALTIPGTSTTYNENTLFVLTQTDPDSRRKMTYTDRKGRTIMSRETDAMNTSPASTYIEYTDKDQPARVIPPGASASNTELIFTYEYTPTGLPAKKKVPGSALEEMSYNTRDLLVFSRDGNQSALSRCLGTKYDDYGRPIETGFVSGFPTNPNQSFTFLELLTKTWYDGYDGTTQLNLTSNPQYRGKVRRSENKVLGSATTFLHTTLTYDTYGRVTTNGGNNYLNPTSATAENINIIYDWGDNKLAENRTHNPGTGATTGIQTINYSWNYDQTGRSTNYYLNLNSQNTPLAEYNYDHRDHIIERNLHSGLYGATWAWLQSLDYAYNDMGWLTAINSSGSGGTTMTFPGSSCTSAMPNPGITTLTKFPENNDLFYMELRYDQLFANNAAGGNIGNIAGGVAQTTGNVSQLAWRVRGRDRQAYNFNYDYLNRLTTATYHDVASSNTATASNRYNETLAYDLRGNITSLQRTGYYSSACNYGQVDNLSYTYTANTNRLASIADSAPATQKTHGFNPGSGGTGYTYDANGNLKTDSYKGITNIAYNHLNLPNVVTFSSGNSIEWIYDAAGMKLRKIVKQGATVQYEQTYAGGLEYRKNGTGSNRVEAIYHAEGRYLNLNTEMNNTLLWQKEYALRDHLGNTRMMFADKNANGIVETPGEITQENHYYPFGLGYEGPWMINDATARDNKQQYNGKEWNDDWALNWNDYGARWYDPAVGRWGQVDQAAETYTSWAPYQYVRNNPIIRIDPNGLWDITVHVYNDRKKHGYGVAIVTNRHGEEVYRFKVRVEGTGGRDRLKTNADTPVGVYDIPDKQKDMWLSGGDTQAYGPNPRLVLNGESGEIMDSGRDGIRIHGGRQTNKKGKRLKSPELRKTEGCIRCYDDDIETLKSITDNLMANDNEEIGGKLTVVADLQKVKAGPVEKGYVYRTPDDIKEYSEAEKRFFDRLQQSMEYKIKRFLRRQGLLP